MSDYIFLSETKLEIVSKFVFHRIYKAHYTRFSQRSYQYLIKGKIIDNLNNLI